jgi:hypothetical protein
MFEDIVLENVQKELLKNLVGIERSLPPDKRGEFLVDSPFGVEGDIFLHTGGPQLIGHMRDIEVLADYKFVNLSFKYQGPPRFYVTPLGIKFYEYLMSSDDPAGTVENEYHKYLSSQEFQEKYSEAYDKWAQSEKMLWGEDSQQNLTTIGHLCREAMQEFADILIRKHDISGEIPPKSSTVARLRMVIDKYRDIISKTTIEFLNALIPYWGTVCDLAQRQEHGSEREGEQLVCEDARRLVFQTIVLFTEIDSAIKQMEKH